MKRTPIEKEVAELRKEVSRLSKQVVQLSRKLEKSRPKTKDAPNKLRVSGLEVVAADGAVVASLDGNGRLFCSTAWISASKKVRGVWIDGVTFRSVSAGKLELIGKSGNKPRVVAEGWSPAGQIKIMDTETSQSVVLQGSGAPLMAYNQRGVRVCMLSTNHEEGAKLKFEPSKSTSKAAAEIGISHLTAGGSVALKSREGAVSGRLP